MRPAYAPAMGTAHVAVDEGSRAGESVSGCGDPLAWDGGLIYAPCCVQMMPPSEDTVHPHCEPTQFVGLVTCPDELCPLWWRFEGLLAITAARAAFDGRLTQAFVRRYGGGDGVRVSRALCGAESGLFPANRCSSQGRQCSRQGNGDEMSWARSVMRCKPTVNCNWSSPQYLMGRFRANSIHIIAEIKY